ncbi:recombinase family protein [Streptomyces sparsogenes]|uniref:recombinase family protein n=1 Tax=Streptomyces sparsogenes TaxID=67365 RepID=UPI000978FF1F|nr:recombinase family protein [Streptomyces sparsogenes]
MAHSSVPATFTGRPRVVGAIRISRYTDASTSPEVQQEAIEVVNDRLGGRVVGWARDPDVSALKTTPWEREELAYWLDRPEDWDVMAWQRIDRAVRSMGDMVDLGRYAKRHGKRLVFASGPGGGVLELDFTSPMSELIMLILAFAAQLEGQTILERNQGAAKHLQSLGRWPGGPIPYGFQPVRKTFADGKEGWWLGEHHPTAKIRRAAIARFIAGKSYSAVTAWLNDTKAVTPANHRARLMKRTENPQSSWTETTVRSMLLSPIVRGYLVKKDGTVLRNSDGSPIMQGVALIDDSTWHKIKEAEAARANPKLSAPRRKDAHDLLGVLLCGVCDHNMHTAVATNRDGSRRHTFTCNSKAHNDGEPYPAVKQQETIDYVDKEFRERFGMFRRTQVVRVAGVDNRPEIAELEETVKELSTRLTTLRGTAADAVASQLQGVSDRLDALRIKPIVPPHIEEIELDTTWGEDWDKADAAGRREILLDLNVRVSVGAPTGWRRPVSERLTFEIRRPDPEADALMEAAHQANL